jgi:N-acetylglucosaminyldiphosphoundecaprenol N-acetyl-beta-D-mannosaminyltransferase
MRRHDGEFRRQTAPFDLYVPDGMPLIWCLNFMGAALEDRVYGPAFMRHVMVEPAQEPTHYLLGGSQECGERLRRTFPRAQIVGSFHGMCDADGMLEGTSGAEVVDEINRLSPDFIWIGLGAPKQERWISRNKDLIRRGVILSVGFAFDVNAGLKKDAPELLQRLGLTWAFRIVSEPRRLAGRYLKYNSLFLFYLLFDSMRGRAMQQRSRLLLADSIKTPATGE